MKRCLPIACIAAATVFSMADTTRADTVQTSPDDQAASDGKMSYSIWYIQTNDQRYGPFTTEQLTTEQLNKFVLDGSLTPESFIWRQGDPQWRSVKECPEFLSTVPSDQPVPETTRQPEEAVSTSTPQKTPNDEEEVAFDLDDLDEEESGAPSSHPESGGHPGGAGGHPGGAGGHPGGEHGGKEKPFKLKLFFDLLLEYEFETKAFQFTRDHAHIMLEMEATDWLNFRADIAFEPEFFEMIFLLGSKAELRLGKILVPFGQNDFHHLIGGRVDRHSLFLPDVWGDYGLAFKHFLYDGEFLRLDYSLWVVNGFQDSIGLTGDPEPSRSAGSLTDNNQMKGIGIRPTIGLGQYVTLGTSWYVDSWDPDNESLMLFYGMDAELGYGLIPVKVLKDFRLRGEIAWGEIQIPKRNQAKGLINHGMRKAGYYGELSYQPLRWLTLRYREGRLNADSRVADANDVLLHAPSVIFRKGPVSFSLVLELLQILSKKPYPEPTDYSTLYLRVLFRY